MDVDAALRALKSPTSLGVATGNTECHLVQATGAIEVSRINSDPQNMSAAEFTEHFKHNDFRRMNVSDHAQ